MSAELDEALAVLWALEEAPYAEVDPNVIGEARSRIDRLLAEEAYRATHQGAA